MSLIDSKDITAFVWLMVAAGMGSIAAFVRCGMTAARYLTIQMPLWILVAGVTTLACYLLVPSMGLRGASMALAISATVQLLTNLAVISHALAALKQNRES